MLTWTLVKRGRETWEAIAPLMNSRDRFWTIWRQSEGKWRELYIRWKNILGCKSGMRDKVSCLGCPINLCTRNYIAMKAI